MKSQDIDFICLYNCLRFGWCRFPKLKQRRRFWDSNRVTRCQKLQVSKSDAGQIIIILKPFGKIWTNKHPLLSVQERKLGFDRISDRKLTRCTQRRQTLTSKLSSATLFENFATCLIKLFKHFNKVTSLLSTSIYKIARSFVKKSFI